MMMLCAACVASAANYLTFTAAEDGSTFGIKNTYNDPDVQYSLDDGATWTVLADGDSIALAKKGDKALLKGNNPEGFSHDYLNCTQFVMSGSISASGSVMSLIDGVGESLTIPNKRCFYYLFRDCGSLIQAPELPATTLKDSCYAYMFYFCTNLEKAAELPATELTPGCYMSMFACCRRLTEVPLMPATVMARRCYDSMFLGCYSLRKTPDLIATTLAKGCYTNMFCYCKGLKEVGELPATELADSCYYSMFQTCDSLVVLPELPATQLAPSCYNSMFEYCVSLTEAPELPATKMAELCYYNMFSNCYSLKKAPELISAEPAARCYNFMFTSCQNLSELKVYFTDLNLEYVDYGSMLSGVSGPGKFICPSQFPADSIKMFLPYLWEVEYFDIVDTTVNYLTFTAEEDGATFTLVNNGTSPDIEYSLDRGRTWNVLTPGEAIPLAGKGDKALLRGNNPNGFSQSWSNYSSFSMTGKIAASGSVMSLVDGNGKSTVIPNGHCFCRLFEGCKALRRFPELPATTLKKSCYKAMFKGCEYADYAPVLPATTMADSCYASMFDGCEEMMVAPALPATKLAVGCYSSMFEICYILAQTPELPATELAEGCYSRMFLGCEGLDYASALPAMTLAKGCYERMFAGSGLSRGPELPATTLAERCYNQMFRSCGDLRQAPELPAMNLAKSCYNHMFSGCVNLEQAPALPATTLADSCYAYMFDECTTFTQIPELPATKLAKGCYSFMFWECFYVRSVTLPATTLAEGCCFNMFDGCSSLEEVRVSFDQWQTADGKPFSDFYLRDVAQNGTFICPKDLPVEYGTSRIPVGWTVKYIDEEGSGVSPALAEGVAVWTDDLTVYVRGAEGEVSLYDMSGKRVAVSNSADEERALGVPAKGVYVVRTSGGERSVLVR